MIDNRPTVWAEKSPDCGFFPIIFHQKEVIHLISGRIHSIESMGLVDGPRHPFRDFSAGLPSPLPVLPQS